MHQNAPFQKHNLNFVFFSGRGGAQARALPLLKRGDHDIYYCRALVVLTSGCSIDTDLWILRD